MYEPEAEEALGKWSSSKYAILDDQGLPKERLLDEDGNVHPSRAYIGRWVPATGDNYRVKTSEVDDQWTPDGLVKPADFNAISIYSMRTIGHGVVTSNVQADSGVFINGFELGGFPRWGQAFYSIDVPDGVIRFAAGGSSQHNYVERTWALPSDYDTAYHYYSVKLMEGMAEFRIDSEVKAVALTAPMDPEYELSGPPYDLFTTRGDIPGALPVLVEQQGPSDSEAKTLVSPKDVRWVEDDPQPPRTWQLYDFQADTLMTSGTYDTGTSHKSHPVPIKGYDAETLLFRADTDSVAGGFRVEVLTQEGNWRAIETYDYTAGDSWYANITAEYPLVRIGYEPSADGASITDAELSMR